MQSPTPLKSLLQLLNNEQGAVLRVRGDIIRLAGRFVASPKMKKGAWESSLHKAPSISDKNTGLTKNKTHCIQPKTWHLKNQ